MNDLINRHAAIELIERMKPYHQEADDIAEMIANMPSAQPEVIRCKDCVHWDTSWQNDYAPNYHYCPMVDGTRKDDFYCADAERRTDG